MFHTNVLTMTDTFARDHVQAGLAARRLYSSDMHPTANSPVYPANSINLAR